MRRLTLAALLLSLTTSAYALEGYSGRGGDAVKVYMTDANCTGSYTVLVHGTKPDLYSNECEGVFINHYPGGRSAYIFGVANPKTDRPVIQFIGNGTMNSIIGPDNTRLPGAGNTPDTVEVNELLYNDKEAEAIGLCQLIESAKRIICQASFHFPGGRGIVSMVANYDELKFSPEHTEQIRQQFIHGR